MAPAARTCAPTIARHASARGECHRRRSSLATASPVGIAAGTPRPYAGRPHPLRIRSDTGAIGFARVNSAGATLAATDVGEDVFRGRRIQHGEDEARIGGRRPDAGRWATA
jgi:hypothetical protein